MLWLALPGACSDGRTVMGAGGSAAGGGAAAGGAAGGAGGTLAGGAGGASAGGTTMSGTGGGGTAGGTGGSGSTDGGLIITIDAGMPATLATGHDAREIALGARDVYWFDVEILGDVGRTWLNKTPKGGATGGWSIQNLGGLLAVNATHVYVTSGATKIAKIPVEGGSPVAFVSAPLLVAGLAVDPASVYWTTYDTEHADPHGTVMKASLATGETTMLASDQGGATDIKVDATAVYWAKYASRNGGGAIMKLPMTGGTPVMLATANSPTGIAIDGDSLYWMESGRQSDGTQTVSALKKVPVSGGSPTTLVSPFSSSGCRAAFVVDGPFIYWAADGAIIRMSVDGGPQMALATGNHPYCLAVDQTHLFWTSNRDGTLRSLPKQ